MSAAIHRYRPVREPLTLAQFIASLALIESTIAWLHAHQLCIISFGCTRRGPTVNVAAHPQAYALAKGQAERLRFRQEGALRHEVWVFTARGGVEIAWEEVVCVS